MSESHSEQRATVEVLERLGREMMRLAAELRPDPEHSLKAKIIWNAALDAVQAALQAEAASLGQWRYTRLTETVEELRR